jgi:hypothetical protein
VERFFVVVVAETLDPDPPHFSGEPRHFLKPDRMDFGRIGIEAEMVADPVALGFRAAGLVHHPGRLVSGRLIV